jgi:hypothetical protein
MRQNAPRKTAIEQNPTDALFFFILGRSHMFGFFFSKILMFLKS